MRITLNDDFVPQSLNPSDVSGPSGGQLLKGVFVSTYGCQMNVNDSERMLALLEMMNYSSVAAPELADLIIINSCSVREKPVHKVRSEVGRYRDLKRKNPALRIGVGGCVAQQEKDSLLKDMPLLDFVFGTDSIDLLPEIVSTLETGKKVVRARFDHQSPYHIQTLLRETKVTAFVNIMKGCDNFCTFCVVPFTRGRERSRPLDQVVKDVQSLVARGVQEVTLLGQNVNSYRSACGADFAQLLLALCESTLIKRIRFTTSHPKDFDLNLAKVLQAHRDKLMDYIHLPAQSGSSAILERMNRGYTREAYIEKAQMLMSEIPGVALSTDIIVGFPGESESQFEETMELLDIVPFENVYSFKYSPRPLTKAARFTDPVSEELMNQRLQRLQRKQAQIAESLAQKYIGRSLEVLVENRGQNSGRLCGRSTQNRLTQFAGDDALIGQTVKVKILQAHAQNLQGELL